MFQHKKHRLVYSNYFIVSFNPESGRLLVESRHLLTLPHHKISMFCGSYACIQLRSYLALSKAEVRPHLHPRKPSPTLFSCDLVLSDISPPLLLSFTSSTHLYLFYSKP